MLKIVEIVSEIAHFHKGGINIELKKNNSLKVSETFFQKLENKFINVSNNLTGYYKTFNNCREQGLMLEIYDDSNDNELLIWACESRNNDNIMVILADKSCSDVNDMFDDKAWKSARYFNADDYDTAVNFTYNIIKKQFSKNFTEKYESKFEMHKCIVDLQRIIEDSKDLNYEDYYELATFECVGKSYFCDLIINEGKVGLRYSKYSEKYNNEYDNLSFEEWQPDLTSSVTLMLGMQERLNNFIEKEIDYDINVSISV